MAEITKRRWWGRWIGFSLAGLIFLLFGGHAFLGWWQERKLNQEIAVLREKGEPILREDFKSKTIADEENAAEVLMRAAKLIDGSSKTMERFSYIALELPLSEKELAIVRPALAEDREAVAVARQA